jgi:hypothetical protein
MEQPEPNEDHHGSGEVVDFDEAVLNACSAQDRIELLREAELLASVFAPRGGAGELVRMAAQLSAGQQDDELGRHHARRLAAALKRLARAA